MENNFLHSFHSPFSLFFEAFFLVLCFPSLFFALPPFPSLLLQEVLSININELGHYWFLKIFQTTCYDVSTWFSSLVLSLQATWARSSSIFSARETKMLWAFQRAIVSWKAFWTCIKACHCIIRTPIHDTSCCNIKMKTHTKWALTHAC